MQSEVWDEMVYPFPNLNSDSHILCMLLLIHVGIKLIRDDRRYPI